MAQDCTRIGSRPDTAKIGSDGRVEVHQPGCLELLGYKKRFHTAWVELGPQAMSDRRPFIPQQPTCGDRNDMSVLCRYCCKKSKVASVRISGETLNCEPVDDSDNLGLAIEVAYEFCVRR